MEHLPGYYDDDAELSSAEGLSRVSGAFSSAVGPDVTVMLHVSPPSSPLGYDCVYAVDYAPPPRSASSVECLMDAQFLALVDDAVVWQEAEARRGVVGGTDRRPPAAGSPPVAAASSPPRAKKATATAKAPKASSPRKRASSGAVPTAVLVAGPGRSPGDQPPLHADDTASCASTVVSLRPSTAVNAVPTGGTDSAVSPLASASPCKRQKPGSDISEGPSGRHGAHAATSDRCPAAVTGSWQQTDAQSLVSPRGAAPTAAASNNSPTVADRYPVVAVAAPLLPPPSMQSPSDGSCHVEAPMSPVGAATPVEPTTAARRCTRTGHRRRGHDSEGALAAVTPLAGAGGPAAPRHRPHGTNFRTSRGRWQAQLTPVGYTNAKCHLGEHGDVVRAALVVNAAIDLFVQRGFTIQLERNTGMGEPEVRVWFHG